MPSKRLRSLVSRNGHTVKQWPQLAEEIAHAVRALSCVLDGEVCCLNPDGRPNFKQLLFRGEWPFFYSFDVLSIEDEDLTGLPLLDRKRRLLGIMPIVDSRLLRLDHIHVRGSDLFRAACELDLEGHRRKVGAWHLSNRRARNIVAEDQKSWLYADPRPSRTVQHSARSSPALFSGPT